MQGINTASPSVAGIQRQNMTNQVVSLGTKRHHNPAPALQQNEQVQQFSQIGLSSTAANDHEQAAPTTVQLNPAPTFQQTEQVLQFSQVGLYQTTADNNAQAFSSTAQVNPAPTFHSAKRAY